MPNPPALKLSFFGGVDEVTGSRHLVETPQAGILLDCGLFQGHRKEALLKNRELPFPLSSVHRVLLSHAHIDHSGGLPVLAKLGYSGPIYSTPATRDLCEIMLEDSAYLQTEDARFFNKIHKDDGERIDPLYEIEDAQKTLRLFKTYGYGETFAAGNGVEAQLLDAGHVLGSAMIKLTAALGAQKRVLLFTGDLGRQESQLMHPPKPPARVDDLLIESTYGGRGHEDLSEGENRFAATIEQAIRDKSKVLIPSFALERTQEILFVLTKLRITGRIGSIPVYLDSPMAINITELFKRYAKDIKFNWGSARPAEQAIPAELVRYARSVEDSKKLNELEGPYIIISASGMCEGGRILHHLRNNINDPNTVVVMVGYQAEGTLGRRLSEGQHKVRIFGLWHEVVAQIKSIQAFSAHADKNDLLRFIRQINPKPKNIFLVHGDQKNRQALADDLKKKGYDNVRLPRYGEAFDL
ncbi:MAG: MBL fold metallo-hydrolase [Elusimicrobia bacterium]|nr:MBL fold metallo-hydrolase [Elusimicrobiota bacterium]